MSKESISTDRFVIYGLTQKSVVEFLSRHKVDADRTIAELKSEFGAPSQVAVGRDGARAKIYWFLPSRDPYFVGADFVNGQALPQKIYSELSVKELPGQVEGLHASLQPHARWLLARDEFAPTRLFHGVGFRRERSGPLAGMHLGLKPDWRGLLRHDSGLLCEGLVRDLMQRLDFQHHWPEVEKQAFAHPMAWTCYVSLQMRPTGELGLTVYSRASPVVSLDNGLALVEPGEGGTYPRPAVITCGHAGLENVSFRFRFHGPDRSFVRRNGWFVDYGPTTGEHRSLSPADLHLIESVAHEACGQAGTMEPVRLMEVLEGIDGVRDVCVGPDLRRET